MQPEATSQDMLRIRFATEMKTCVMQGCFEAPRLPHLATEVLNLANDPEASLRTIGGLLARDPGLTARVLHLANSVLL